jgi:hypothetical protein
LIVRILDRYAHHIAGFEITRPILLAKCAADLAGGGEANLTVNSRLSALKRMLRRVISFCTVK